MIKFLNKNFKLIDNKDKFFFIILAFFPLSLVIGNTIINLIFFSGIISFFININDANKYFRNKIIILFFFFFLTLILNVFFSIHPLNSLPRAVKILFVLFFIIEIIRLFDKYDFYLLENIFKIWTFIFFIILFDVFFELYFGFNTIGFKSVLPTRVASFFGDELVVGAFIHGFALFTISYLIFKKTNNLILISVILLIIIGSFLIGERSNFLKLLISITLFSALALKIKTHYKIYALVLIIISLGISLSLNEKMKYRYFYELESLFHKNGIEKYFKSSQYGAHQNTAFNIFKDYPLFGIGIKNFRFESNKEKYFNNEYEHANVRSATHPHQTHLEFLSETGLFGYFSFLFLILYTLIKAINVYMKNKNVFQLSAIIFIFSIMIPLLPSGSFLSTFNSAIIWINFAIMIGFNKKLKF